MLAVNVRQDGITVTGHAGYAPPGQDIVCAGVSTLVQTLIQSIENLTEDKIEYELSPGGATIKHGILSERAQVLKESFFIGVGMIAGAYPHHVELSRRG